MNKILSSLCLIAILASATTITSISAEAKGKVTKSTQSGKHVRKVPRNTSHKVFV